MHRSCTARTLHRPFMRLYLRRGRIFRHPLRPSLANRISGRCPPPPWSRDVHSAATSPPTIAALLRQTQPSSSPPLHDSSGETLTVNGFVRTVRKQKRVAFAAIGDGSSLETVQAVLTPDQAEGLVLETDLHSSTDLITQTLHRHSGSHCRPVDAISRSRSIA